MCSTYVDLKSLLLESVNNKKVLTFRKRVLVGDHWFKIHFLVSGKYLELYKIKQLHGKDSFIERVRKRKSLIKKVVRNHHMRTPKLTCVYDKETQTNDNCVLDEESQTVSSFSDFPEVYSEGTQTREDLDMWDKKIQTSRKIRNVFTQTESKECVSSAVQTRNNTETSGSQTEWMNMPVKSKAFMMNSTNSRAQTELPDAETIKAFVEDIKEECKTMMTIVADMAKLMVEHTELMQNNSTLLNKISEYARLSRSAIQQDLGACSREMGKQLQAVQRSITSHFKYKNVSPNTYGSMSTRKSEQKKKTSRPAGPASTASDGGGDTEHAPPAQVEASEF